MTHVNSVQEIPFRGRILDIAYINEECKAPFIGLTVELFSDLITLPKSSEVLVFISEPKAMQILKEEMVIISKLIDDNPSTPPVFIDFSSHSIFFSINEEAVNSSASIQMEIHLKEVFKLKIKNRVYELKQPVNTSHCFFKPPSWVINLMLSFVLLLVIITLMNSVFSGNLIISILLLFFGVFLCNVNGLLKAIDNIIK